MEKNLRKISEITDTTQRGKKQMSSTISGAGVHNYKDREEAAKLVRSGEDGEK